MGQQNPEEEREKVRCGYSLLLKALVIIVFGHGCGRGTQNMSNSEVPETWIDRPEILAVVFHPRLEYGPPESGNNFEELSIPVDRRVVIGGRFYSVGKNQPVILFFHGNGEIVADYHDTARYYTQMKVNFLPVDYRGYGKSTGSPTVTAMLKDARKIYAYIRGWLSERGYIGPFVVMGRSLGSASALELAATYSEDIDGLIIESGFAHVMPLLQRLGADLTSVTVQEESVLQQTNKIGTFTGPTLIIHGEQDHIIPFSDAKALYKASQSSRKKLVEIPGADHNSVLMVGFETYMRAVSSFLHSLETQINQP